MSAQQSHALPALHALSSGSVHSDTFVVPISTLPTNIVISDSRNGMNGEMSHAGAKATIVL